MKVLLTHPSADLYGSDRMAALAMRALIRRGHSVTAVVPIDGPLVSKMRETQGCVVVADTPVLRKADLRPRSFLRLAARVLLSQYRIASTIRAVKPDVVYVNTIVQPWWIAGCRLQRRRAVVHVREAEAQSPRVVRALLNLPLLMADAVVCNSMSTANTVSDALPVLRGRTSVVYNGKDWSAYRCTRAQRSGDSATLRLTIDRRITPEKRSGPVDFVESLRQRLALLSDQSFRELGTVRVDGVGERQHCAAPLGQRGVAPRRKGSLGRGHRLVDVCRVSARNRAEYRLGRGIHDVKSPAGIDQRPVDEQSQISHGSPFPRLDAMYTRRLGGEGGRIR